MWEPEENYDKCNQGVCIVEYSNLDLSVCTKKKNNNNNNRNEDFIFAQ
jgi:hypothetical protein